MRARGVVINVHRLGATVRLEDGRLAAVPGTELGAHGARLTSSQKNREPLYFALDERQRHPIAFPSEAEADGVPAAAATEPASVFEDRIRAYLKQTEEWAPPDRPEPAARHFIRKKRRAASFEARARGV